MGELKIKLDDVDVLLNSIKTNKDAIDISVTSINEPSMSKDIMLTEYIKKIRIISDLLDKYKQLLEKDISDIDMSKEKILEMDKQMVGISKSN